MSDNWEESASNLEKKVSLAIKKADKTASAIEPVVSRRSRIENGANLAVQVTDVTRPKEGKDRIVYQVSVLGSVNEDGRNPEIPFVIPKYGVRKFTPEEKAAHDAEVAKTGRGSKKQENAQDHIDDVLYPTVHSLVYTYFVEQNKPRALMVKTRPVARGDLLILRNCRTTSRESTKTEGPKTPFISLEFDVVLPPSREGSCDIEHVLQTRLSFPSSTDRHFYIPASGSNLNKRTWRTLGGNFSVFEPIKLKDAADDKSVVLQTYNEDNTTTTVGKFSGVVSGSVVIGQGDKVVPCAMLLRSNAPKEGGVVEQCFLFPTSGLQHENAWHRLYMIILSAKGVLLTGYIDQEATKNSSMQAEDPEVEIMNGVVTGAMVPWRTALESIGLRISRGYAQKVKTIAGWGGTNQAEARNVAHLRFDSMPPEDWIFYMIVNEPGAEFVHRYTGGKQTPISRDTWDDAFLDLASDHPVIIDPRKADDWRSKVTVYAVAPPVGAVKIKASESESESERDSDMSETSRREKRRRVKK